MEIITRAHSKLNSAVSSIKSVEVGLKAGSVGILAIAFLGLLSGCSADSHPRFVTSTPSTSGIVIPTQPTQPFANELTLCGDVPEGGTVSGTIMRVNNNQWPPNQFNGLDIYFSLDHNGKRIMAPIREINATKDANVASEGDDVCIGRGDLLAKRATATPQEKK